MMLFVEFNFPLNCVKNNVKYLIQESISKTLGPVNNFPRKSFTENHLKIFSCSDVPVDPLYPQIYERYSRWVTENR